MYHEQQKTEFIEYYVRKSNAQDEEALRRSMVNFFNRLGKIETDFGQDFCEYEYDTALLALGSLCTGSTDYHELILSQLRQYEQWCIKNGKTHLKENVLDGITWDQVDPSGAYRFTMVRDEAQLGEYLDAGYSPLHEDAIDNLYRAYCWLLYSGVPPEKAPELMVANVKKDSGTVDCGFRTVELKGQAQEAVRYLLEMDGYIVKRKYGGCLYKKAGTGHLLELKTANRQHLPQYLFSNLSNFNQRLREEFGQKIRLTSSNLFLSGIFRRAYEADRKTDNPSLEEYFTYLNEYREFQKKDTFQKNHFIRLVGVRYHYWKKAFDL